MNIIDEKLVNVFLKFTLQEISIGNAIKKVKKICSEPQKRKKCKCYRPVAEELTPTTCIRCDGWICMKKYPYKII